MLCKFGQFWDRLSDYYVNIYYQTYINIVDVFNFHYNIIMWEQSITQLIASTNTDSFLK